MENKQQEPENGLEPIIEYEDYTNYVPSEQQLEYEQFIRNRMAKRRREAQRRRVKRNRAVTLVLILLIAFIVFKSCSSGDSGDEAVTSQEQTQSSQAGEESSKAAQKAAVQSQESDSGADTQTESEHTIEQIDGMTFVDGILIVNKTYSLPADYDPGVSAVAQNAFDRMAADALNDGIYLFIVSGYRSYSKQEELYNMYAAERGVEEADKVSSRPGHSEHQTGLTFDVNSTEFSFADTAEAKWLAAHCTQYGFIIRFPEGKEDITGYEYEPWHIRYIGVEEAQKVQESGLCLEEYLGVTSDYADSEDYMDAYTTQDSQSSTAG